MTVPSLSAVNNEWWDRACLRLKNAVVFMDDEACECLHWNGGLARLLTAGVSNIKSFSSFEEPVPDQKKAVFIICAPLFGTKPDTVQTILKCNDFRSCLILTAAHFGALHFAYPSYKDEDELLRKLRTKFLFCMHKSSTLEIEYAPIFMAPLCSSLFVTPAFCSLFPILPTDLKNIEFDRNIAAIKEDKKFPEELNEIEFSNLPLHFQLKMLMFAHCFNSFLESLDVKEDYFTVGCCSRVIASVLDGLSVTKTRRKTAQNKASVLFLDRTLDIVSPSGHGIDTLMDRILNLLPRLPGHKNDVAIDMHPVSDAMRSDSKSSYVLAPGCLAPCYDSQPTGSVLNTIFLNKPKECLMEINRTLVDVVMKEKLLSTSIKPGRINVDTIEKHINLFRCKQDLLKRHGVVQSALAVTQTLKHLNNSHLDQLYGIEKGLIQSLGDISTSQSTLSQIIQLLKTRKERSISVEEILILLLHVYSLAGDKVCEWQDEDKLQEEIAQALIDDSETLSNEMKHYIGEDIDEYSTHSAVEYLFQHLHDLANLRSELKQYRNLYNIGLRSQPATYSPLIQQILNDMLNPANPELLDVEYKSSGLKSMIKTGVSFFMNVNKPRPCDNPLLIFFVIGGITSSEFRQIREAIVNQCPHLQLLVGSTQLVIPEDILHHILNPSVTTTF